jgi:hypothetical protein
MKDIKRLLRMPVVPAVFFFTLPGAADLHYIELGGVILPFIIAALVGASATIVIYWRKVRAFFGSRFHKGNRIRKDNDSGED